VDLDERQAEINGILKPEPDPDLSERDIAHPRLRDVRQLDVSYLDTFVWEGPTTHPNTRIILGLAWSRSVLIDSS
jgi:hypothetical protein